MTGWHKTLSALLISITALSIPSALLLAFPDRARAASLSTRLTHARRELRHARATLRHDHLAYAAALAAASLAPADAATPTPSASPSDSAAAAAAGGSSASPSPTPVATAVATPALTIAQLLRAVRGDQRRVRALHARVGRLRHELALRRAAAHGNWMPIVREAARRNHISASGLRRLMSLESGGRRHADSGSFHGLYQYCWSTWRAAWNPWRGSSLYDGGAQIRATAVAIRRGMGPRMWPNTYWRAF